MASTEPLRSFLHLQETQRLIQEPGNTLMPNRKPTLYARGARCLATVVLLAAPGISASPSEDNLRYFNVMILGPQQSPYEGEHLLPDFLVGDVASGSDCQLRMTAVASPLPCTQEAAIGSSCSCPRSTRWLRRR